MTDFPIFSRQIRDNPIKVGNGLSILAEFRYWEDADKFCQHMSGTGDDIWYNLYVWQNDKPIAIWKNGIEIVVGVI